MGRTRRQNQPCSPDEVADMARMYLLEMRSLREIGDLLRRDHTTVRKALMRNGVELRDKNDELRRLLKARQAAEGLAVGSVQRRMNAVQPRGLLSPPRSTGDKRWFLTGWTPVPQGNVLY